MEVILAFIAAVFAPLSSTLILAVIIGGLFHGALYNWKLNIPKSFVSHQLTAGIAFLSTLFIFRSLTAVFEGTALVSPAGWIGIAILWSIFCLFIWVGHSARRRK